MISAPSSRWTSAMPVSSIDMGADISSSSGSKSSSVGNGMSSSPLDGVVAAGTAAARDAPDCDAVGGAADGTGAPSAPADTADPETGPGPELEPPGKPDSAEPALDADPCP